MTDKSIIMRTLVLSHLRKRPVQSQQQRRLQRRYPRMQGPAISRFLLRSLLYRWPVRACTISSLVSLQKQWNAQLFKLFFAEVSYRRPPCWIRSLGQYPYICRDLKIARWRMTSSHEYNACRSKRYIYDSKKWRVRIGRGHGSSKAFVYIILHLWSVCRKHFRLSDVF